MATDRDLNARGSIAADPLRNFRFLVSFYPTVYGRGTTPGWKPVGRFGFTSVSGFAFSMDPIEIREGGYNATTHQIPSHVRYSALQFDRGISLGTWQNWDWMRMMLKTVQGKSVGSEAYFRSDIEIAVLVHPVTYAAASKEGTGYGQGTNAWQAARDDLVALRFRVYNAWPSSVVYSDVNAGDNALMVERMTVVHEGLDLAWGDQRNGQIISAHDFGMNKKGFQ